MLVTEGVSDLYKQPEYIFFGPDENTADKMDAACLFTKTKGYGQWKSITTGKSTKLGGIPHDAYGMTTRSVRQYTIGIQEKLGLKQSECTKFITGGPDGDLGSNEILMGVEKIVGIVDGSGVLVDPKGIEREALLQLVRNRLTVENFKGTLSDQGYLVKVNDTNVTLPDGRLIESGVALRNTLHLDRSITADFFTPCGGRPEAINLQNVKYMFLEDGVTPRFPYIVEGANLFITEQARQVLEKAGVILFKDASTNKGGVTSSSLEVLACLAFDDKSFAENMTGEDAGQMPEFYNEYVKEICERVETNARNEFEFIWREKQKQGKMSITLTNEVSENMNNLSDIIHGSQLFENEALRNNVLKELMPKTLLAKLGFENIIKRVPATYLKALFSKYLAAKYYYTIGAESNLYLFYEFMKSYN